MATFQSWQPKDFQKSFLRGLSAHSKQLANQRANLLGMPQAKSKRMVSAFYNPPTSTVTPTYTGTQFLWVSASGASGTTTSSTASNTITGQTFTATQTFGNTQWINPSTGMSPEEAENFLKSLGRIILKRQKQALLPMLDFMAGPSDSPNMHKPVRIVDAFQLPEQDADYVMPDGSILAVDRMGNYRIEDREAKVIYRANKIREFNPYVSASDLLEKFIDEMGLVDRVRQDEILSLPIEAFINWLILQAAKRDGDPTEGLPTVESALPPPSPAALPAPRYARPRCGICQRFMPRARAALAYCSPAHYQIAFNRAVAPI